MNLDLDAALDYLAFTVERHRIWQLRQHGVDQPWTSDPILASRKFTNTFRILDHDSQWIMRELIDPALSERDQLMRLFLFRHTGRTGAWEFCRVMAGAYPDSKNLTDSLAAFKEYRSAGHSVFVDAYLVYPQSTVPGTDKLDSIFDLAYRLFHPGSATDIVPDFLAARSQAARFAVLRRNKGVADFMSQQVLADWGWTPHCGEDLENEFVVPGPGARKGAAVIAPGEKAERVLEWAMQAIADLPVRPQLTLPDGRIRELDLMSCQNTLCEASKYFRYQQKPIPSKLYTPAHPGPQRAPIYPAHW